MAEPDPLDRTDSSSPPPTVAPQMLSATPSPSGPLSVEPKGRSAGEADDQVRAQLKRMSRRGFAMAGGAAVALGCMGWWIASRPLAEGIPWPLRRLLEMNERLARAVFRPTAQAPIFARDRAVEPRPNGNLGMLADDGLYRAPDPREWRLRIEGGEADRYRELTLDELRQMPRAEHTTELKCIEGWSAVVHWAGVRLVDVAAETGLASRSGMPFDAHRPSTSLYEYVGMATEDGEYYVGLDTPSALHDQTLLCYEMNGEPLTPEHGAPLRLVIPVKYGIKNIKQLASIRFTDTRPADYWAERGYDWFAGH